jgi:hypothetical protein
VTEVELPSGADCEVTDDVITGVNDSVVIVVATPTTSVEAEGAVSVILVVASELIVVSACDGCVDVDEIAVEMLVTALSPGTEEDTSEEDAGISPVLDDVADKRVEVSVVTPVVAVDVDAAMSDVILAEALLLGLTSAEELSAVPLDSAELTAGVLEPGTLVASAELVAEAFIKLPDELVSGLALAVAVVVAVVASVSTDENESDTDGIDWLSDDTLELIVFVDDDSAIASVVKVACVKVTCSPTILVENSDVVTVVATGSPTRKVSIPSVVDSEADEVEARFRSTVNPRATFPLDRTR